MLLKKPPSTYAKIQDIMKTYYNGKEITTLFIIALFIFLLIYSLIQS